MKYGFFKNNPHFKPLSRERGFLMTRLNSIIYKKSAHHDDVRDAAFFKAALI